MRKSSTTDAMDDHHDRYSVSHSAIPSRDGEESHYQQSVSVDRTTISASDSESGTYGTTSYMTDGTESQSLEHDESYDEFGDLDALSLESQPMAVDGWVDSACTCLDHPVMLYQRMCLGRETSLLRQSKGIPRPNLNYNGPTSPTNLSKRRNLRLKNKGIKSDDTNDHESTMADSRSEIHIMRIQPNEDWDFDEVESSSRKRQQDKSTHEKMEEKTIVEEDRSIDDELLLEPNVSSTNSPNESNEKETPTEETNANEEPEEEPGILNTKSMLERAIQKAVKEDEEREIQSNLSKSLKEADVKIDPPSDSQITANRGGQPASGNLESSTSNRDTHSVPQKDEISIEKMEDPSGRSQRSPSPPLSGQRSPSPPIMSEERNIEEMTRRSNNSLQKEERETPSSNDEKSLSNSIEIISVLSMDDNDSWIPGSRNDIDHPNSKSGIDLHQDNHIPISSNDQSSIPKSNPSPSNQNSRSERLRTVDATSVDELWFEEEAKLSQRLPSTPVTSPRSRGLSTAQSAEDVWNEEKMKLQVASNNIFDDPKAREAFLGHRQGRLRDTGMENASILHSRSRRQKMKKVLNGRGREDFDSSKLNERVPRSKSLVRNPPPSPEVRSVIQQTLSESVARQGRGESAIQQSRSESRGRVASTNSFNQGIGEPLNGTPLSYRKKDLVAVRSIEEGQRIRSKRGGPVKYNGEFPQKSSVRDPIDVRNYVGESSTRVPFDEDPTGHRRLARDRARASSLPGHHRSKSRDPTGATATVDDPVSSRHAFNDERDDQESLPPMNPIENRPSTPGPVEKNWSGYDNAISATKELRKLEKKIERQLRRADLDPQTVQSEEIRRMERKLSKKLRSVKSDELEGQAMSERELRRLEKQLAQKISSDNENRASKLKRIKRKGTTAAARAFLPSSSKTNDERLQNLPKAPSSEEIDQVGIVERSPEFVGTTSAINPSASTKQLFSQMSQGSRAESPKYEHTKSLRSRYVRRNVHTRKGLGNRGYARVPETD